MPVSPMSKPVIVKHDGILVVRDDLLAGGTKRRVIPALFDDHDEYVYAGPVQGYAQLALAIAALEHGKHATVFCAKRRIRHPRTEAVIAAGGNVEECSPGYLSVVRKRASDYCHERGVLLLPFGLDCPTVVNGIATVARSLQLCPKEVWTVAGSGTLSRALQLVWPDARFFAVRIGAMPDAGRAEVIDAPERFENDAKEPPPFPSCGNYDAKAWRFIKQRAAKEAVFWNVAGND
jgi:hypothetical protein